MCYIDKTIIETSLAVAEAGTEKTGSSKPTREDYFLFFGRLFNHSTPVSPRPFFKNRSSLYRTRQRTE